MEHLIALSQLVSGVINKIVKTVRWSIYYVITAGGWLVSFVSSLLHSFWRYWPTGKLIQSSFSSIFVKIVCGC